MSDRESEGWSEARTSPLQWTIAGISLLLLLASTGLLLYDGLRPAGISPRIIIEVDTIIDTGSGFVVEFVAENRGHGTAAGLGVEGELRSGSETLETSQTTIDYVPPNSRRRGGLFFSEDPRKSSLRLRPLGYDQP